MRITKVESVDAGTRTGKTFISTVGRSLRSVVAIGRVASMVHKTNGSMMNSLKLDPQVATLDLLPVEYLLRTTFGWPKSRIKRASMGYRGFLQIVRDGTILHCVPSIDVDRTWECHVLCSEKYFADCQLLFQEYLHHWPFSGRFGEDDAARQWEAYQASQRAFDAIRAEDSR